MTARVLAALASLAVVGASAVVALERPTATAPAQAAPAQAAPGARRTPSTPAASGFRVAGLMINAAVHTGADPDSDDDFGVESAFFGSQARTSLSIEYRHEAGGMLDLDAERCRLTRFADDRGTDLMQAQPLFGPFELMPRVSADGRHLVFVVPSDELPAAGATRLSAAGVLAVRVATQKQDFASEVVTLTEGLALSLGNYELRVEDFGPSQWGEGHALTIGSRRDLGTIESWALVLPDGREVELSPSMSMSGMGTWQQTLELERPVECARLRITCWADLHTIEVPFEVDAGLGLR